MHTLFVPLVGSLPLKRKPIVTLHLRGDAIYRNAQGKNFAGGVRELGIDRIGLERMQSTGMVIADHHIVHGETGCTGGQ